MKSFKINDNTEILCNWVKTRAAFKHVAELHVNGRFVMETKICYLNRTWESFEFESVISQLLRKAKIMTEDEQRVVMDRLAGKSTEELNDHFGMIAGIAKLGEILCDTAKEQNDWKSRMIKAGMGEGIMMPDDWDTLSEEDKATRLNNVINELQK